MQLRRLALAAGIVASLSALGWFAARGVQAHAARAAPLSGLTVRILTPESKPLSGAEVSYVFHRRLFSGGSSMLTDASGCVRLGGEAGAALDLRAADPTNRYAPAYAFDEHEREGALDMRLEPATARTLVVVDEQGAAVESYAWRILDQQQYRSHRTAKTYHDAHGLLCDTRMGEGSLDAFAQPVDVRPEHPQGRTELRTGNLDFVVQVDALEFAPAQAGPFTPATAPPEIRISLRRLPGIRGRVVSEGKGVARAWVKLIPPPEDGRSILINGFPSRLAFSATSESRCADDGSFTLRLRTSGEFTIQAGAETGCVAELGPRHYSADAGAAGLELVLPRPGAMEGRLLLAGRLEAGHEIIGASRGDGRACSVRVGAEGYFRFEGLTPGSWLLRPLNADLDSSKSQSWPPPEARLGTTLPFTCDVVAGQTTHVEIDLHERPTFEGGVRLLGWENASTTGGLEPLGSTYSRFVPLKREGAGTLHASVDQPGDYLIRVHLKAGERGPVLTVLERRHLFAGANLWILDGPVGELVVVNALEEQATVLLRCQLPGDRTLRTATSLRARGESRLSGLPLGKWTIVHTEHGIETELAAAEVTSDAPARMELK